VKGGFKLKNFLLIPILLIVLILSSCGTINGTVEDPKQMGNMKPVSGNETNSDWITPETITAKQAAKISVIIKDQKNKPIKKFETVSTKKMHLVVVSKDLSYFAHIHPAFMGNGRFEITTTFPAGGDYKLIAEMTPVGASDYSIENDWVSVKGSLTKSTPITPDKNLTKVINGIKINISFDGKPKAKKNIEMTYSLFDAKSNKPINNLKPYLGTVGHAVAIDKDVKQFMHIHPMYPKGKGPYVVFMTYFPTKGIYKVWGQFNVNGHILTVPFVIKVE
jgi:hypothetical protein